MWLFKIRQYERVKNRVSRANQRKKQSKYSSKVQNSLFPEQAPEIMSLLGTLLVIFSWSSKLPEEKMLHAHVTFPPGQSIEGVTPHCQSATSWYNLPHLQGTGRVGRLLLSWQGRG